MTNLSEIEKALRDLHGLDPEWNKLCGQAADAIRDLQRQNDELTTVVADCRSAAGWGTPDDPMNVQGWSALGDPAEVPGFIRDQFRDLQSKLATAEGKVGELEADARRYRWIKEQNGQLVPRDICLTFNTGHDWLRLDALDKRIDAALNTETTG